MKLSEGEKNNMNQLPPWDEPSKAEKNTLSPDFEQAIRHLTLLDEEAEQFTFQTFDDNKLRRDRSLARIIHGSLEDKFDELKALNDRGAGIFVTVNETNFKGRTNDSIVRIRSLFQEDDGAGKTLPVEPHIVIESSPNKYHRYLLVDDFSKDDFEPYQNAIINDYGSDPNVKDKARVLRLAGFFHRKSEPFKVKIISESSTRPYSLDYLRQHINPVASVTEIPSVDPVHPSTDGGYIKAIINKISLDAAARTWKNVNIGRHDQIVMMGNIMRRDGIPGTDENFTLALKTFQENMRNCDTNGVIVGMNWNAEFRSIKSVFNNPSAPDRQVNTSPIENFKLGSQQPLNNFDFLELEDDLLKPYEWVIDNLVYAGQMNISGSQGVGKTTSIVPICLGICGAVKYPEVPIKIKRKVLYITEDPDQVWRLLHGAKKYQDVDPAYLREWFKVLPADHRKISEYAHLAEKVKELETEYSCKTGLQTIKPLVVFDTVSNAIAMENENDNTEAAQIISQLRMYLNCPHWLVTHMPKSVSRAEVEEMSSRGAGAWEANVQGVFRLFADKDDTRIFYGNARNVKRRDFGKVTELSINGEIHSETRIDRFGEPQEIPYFVASIKESSDEQRKEKQNQDKRNAENLAIKSLQERILSHVFELEEARKVEHNRHDKQFYPSKSDLEKHEYGGGFGRGMIRKVLNDLIDKRQIVKKTEPVGTVIFEDGKSRSRDYFAVKKVEFNVRPDIY